MSKPSTTGQRNEITLGIMGEKVNNIEKSLEELKTWVKELTIKVDDTYATKTELFDIKQDVDDLRNNNKWIVRLILGIVISAVLALIIGPRVGL